MPDTENKKMEGGCKGCGDKSFITVFRAKIPHSSEMEYLTIPEEGNFDTGDEVIAQSYYGLDYMIILGRVQVCSDKELKSIVRKMNDQDKKKKQENDKKEVETFEVCRDKIEKHKLEMKLVKAHYLLDEPKVLFFFTAESRVDFRELVKDLVSVFKMRIELRQIGVRDESRVLGGMGVCGRTYCCHGITDELSPVSIKMAKEQNLSLNSMKISGPCGRLLCCLAYEHDFYHKERRIYPQEGAKVFFKNDSYMKVQELNILSKTIKIGAPDGRYLFVPASSVKKNDQGNWFLDEVETEA